jgi:hypothetical protein
MTIKDLSDRIDTQAQVINALEETIEALNAKIDAIGNHVSSINVAPVGAAQKPKPKDPGPVTIDGKKYRFKFLAFRLPMSSGQIVRYTAEEASRDNELCRRLITEGVLIPDNSFIKNKLQQKMSCVNTLANITRKCGTKVAVGLESYLYIARKDEVQAIAAPGAGTLNVATITMVGGAGFRKIETALTLSKNTWNSAPNEDKDVTNHVTTVSVFHAGIGAAESYILGGTAGQDFVVVCEDRDGNKRIVGDIKTGCTVKVTEGHQRRHEWIHHRCELGLCTSALLLHRYIDRGQR